jgi:hypothetical protein
MKTKLILPAVFLAASVSSLAQNFHKKGTTELGGGISYSSVSADVSGSSYNNEAVGTLIFSPYFGYMVANGFELGFSPQVLDQEAGGSSSTILGFYASLASNINLDGATYPFIELMLGYNSVEDGDGFGFGLNGGVKVNVAGNALLLLQLQFLHQTFERDGSNYFSAVQPTITLTTVAFGLGFRVFFPQQEKKK